MARLSSELAARAAGGQFDLVLIAARRTRELKSGWRPLIEVEPGESESVTALREIEAGLIGRDYLFKPANIDRRRDRPPEN